MTALVWLLTDSVMLLRDICIASASIKTGLQLTQSWPLIDSELALERPYMY